MSLDSPAKYPYVLRSCLHHWGTAEEELGEAVVLREGDRAAGLALKAELDEAVDEVRRAGRELDMARAQLHTARALARGGLERFHAVVRAYWRDTPWADVVGRLPAEGAALDKFLRPCRDGLRLWERLEAEAPPPGAPMPIRIGREGETGRAEYAAVLEDLRLKGLAVEEAEFALAGWRARRNAVMRRVKALLLGFHRVLRAMLPVDHTLVVTLPRLWPLPGHTPDPVRAAAEWVVERGLARVSWTESKDAALDHYEVRGCPGGKYDRAEEELLGKVPAGGERFLETARLLETPGAEGCFRVYVVLKTGNERASNPVPVERPG